MARIGRATAGEYVRATLADSAGSSAKRTRGGSQVAAGSHARDFLLGLSTMERKSLFLDGAVEIFQNGFHLLLPGPDGSRERSVDQWTRTAVGCITTRIFSFR